MKLTNLKIETAPNPNWVRTSIDVTFTSTSEKRNYWFEVEKPFASYLEANWDAWLCFAAPYALLLGEDIEIDGPVDRLLFNNVSALIRQWKQFHPQYRSPKLNTAGFSPPSSPKPQEVGAFFSGGVDSLFTLLRNTGSPNSGLDGHYTVDKLLLVWGFDIPLDNAALFDTTRTYLQDAAEKLGKTLIVIRTNLLEWHDTYENSWEKVVHGSALAAVAHLLGKKLHTVLIGSTFTYGQLIPFGSHPLTDPLHTSSRTRIVHDGAQFNRIQKTLHIATSPMALQLLRVCTKTLHADQLNCSRCQKCLRTMLTLDLAGQTRNARTFRWDGYSPNLFRNIFLKTYSSKLFAVEIRAYATALNRQDVVAAVSTALMRAKLQSPLGILETFLRNRFPKLLRYKSRLLPIKKRIYALCGFSG
ncbi:hypothetical protein [Filomicrobium sp.]|uniref:hypothetical protein n=1 Tax=Filomicrobium sp. TaxID=2024831 RepID=UPI002587A1C7|nr:hypothetical protein [Filomicrobium sp.]MCV0371835.1 hypothetical protein [Filomicrobium sp.]